MRARSAAVLPAYQPNDPRVTRHSSVKLLTGDLLRQGKRDPGTNLSESPNKSTSTSISNLGSVDSETVQFLSNDRVHTRHYDLGGMGQSDTVGVGKDVTTPRIRITKLQLSDITTQPSTQIPSSYSQEANAVSLSLDRSQWPGSSRITARDEFVPRAISPRSSSVAHPKLSLTARSLSFTSGASGFKVAPKLKEMGRSDTRSELIVFRTGSKEPESFHLHKDPSLSESLTPSLFTGRGLVANENALATPNAPTTPNASATPQQVNSLEQQHDDVSLPRSMQSITQRKDTDSTRTGVTVALSQPVQNDTRNKGIAGPWSLNSTLSAWEEDLVYRKSGPSQNQLQVEAVERYDSEEDAYATASLLVALSTTCTSAGCSRRGSDIYAP